jgi:hypothetical protein
MYNINKRYLHFIEITMLTSIPNLKEDSYYTKYFDDDNKYISTRYHFE